MDDGSNDDDDVGDVVVVEDGSSCRVLNLYRLSTPMDTLRNSCTAMTSRNDIRESASRTNVYHTLGSSYANRRLIILRELDLAMGDDE